VSLEPLSARKIIKIRSIFSPVRVGGRQEIETLISVEVVLLAQSCETKNRLELLK
jgi:hypothetical protein